jgi:hypothetical protein
MHFGEGDSKLFPIYENVFVPGESPVKAYS